MLTTALELFSRDGYEATTQTAIAERAGLHLQTLIRHFPTKADIVAGIWQQSVEQFETFFLERESDAISAWRQWVELNAKQITQQDHINASAQSLPILTPEAQDALSRYREIIAEGIAEDMGVDPNADIRPMLIACMLFGANVHVAETWRKRRFNEEAYIASLLEVVTTAEEMLAHLFPAK
ncbi:MAG: TetR/AcrR family transcriptional regulator [Pseudomonadota bacterium]